MSAYVFDVNVVIDAPTVQEAHDKFCNALQTYPEISVLVSNCWFDEFGDQIPLDQVREAINTYWAKQKDMSSVSKKMCVDLDNF